MDRRNLLKNSFALGGLTGLGAVAGQKATAQAARVPLIGRPPVLAPIRAHVDRIYDIKSCLRPFRTKGPNLGVEQIGDATVVHNYGHAGDGWTLSWGSADMQVQKAMSLGPKKIAVIGCGIIGLTSALTAQRAGAEVTIYTREMLWRTRSVRANGVWGPGIGALASEAPANLADICEQMCRVSLKTYRFYTGLAGNPIAWCDHYDLSDTPFDAPPPPPVPLPSGEPAPVFFRMPEGRLADLTPNPEVLAPSMNPFPVRYATRTSKMYFNFSEYGHLLVSQFLAAGGKIVMRDFHSPGELAHLPEKVIINCPGYAAHDWWKDKAMVPQRGQTEWLIPQPEVNYGVTYRNVQARSKSDGIMVIAVGDAQHAKSWNNSNEIPDRAEAEGAVRVMEELFSRFTGVPA